VSDIRFGWRALFLFIPCLVLGAMGANGYPVLLPLAVTYFIIAAAFLSAAKGINSEYAFGCGAANPGCSRLSAGARAGRRTLTRLESAA